MVLDAVSNFVRGNTDAAIASGDSTISVADASIFPDPATDGEFNVVIWNASNFPRPDQDANVEIVRVTARDTGTNELTVTRAQEMTTAAAHPNSSAIHLSPTAKMFSDIEGTFADFWNADTQELTADVNNTNTTTETLEGGQAQFDEGSIETVSQSNQSLVNREWVLQRLGQFVPDGSIHEYLYTEGSGTTVADSEGNKDLTAVGSPTWEESDFSEFEVQTDGEDDGFSTERTFTTFDDGLTLAIRTQSLGPQDDDAIIGGLIAEGSARYDFTMNIDSGNVQLFVTDESGTTYNNVTNHSPSTSEHELLTLTNDGNGTTEFWVDETKIVDDDSLGGGILENGRDYALDIGYDSGGETSAMRHYNGAFAQTWLFDEALGEDQIESLVSFTGGSGNENSGSVTYTATSGDTQSVHDALATATNGDTVIVPDGEYELVNHFVVPSGVTVEFDDEAHIIKVGQQDESTKAMLSNAEENGTLSGYQDSDITIRGGVWDANDDVHINPCFTFVHAENVQIEGCTFKNVYFNHHIEFCAVRDSEIVNCEFSDLRNERGPDSWSEMIQLEPSNNTDSLRASSGSDPTDNILIEGCSFEDSINDDIGPVAGIGDHGDNDGVDTTNINIINNTFTDLEAGVRPVGFDTVLIEDNHFEDCDEDVTNDGSNVTINNNTSS